MAVPERAMLRNVLTTCPFCSCGCGLYLHGEASLSGTSPSDSHPIAHGRLCARGWAAHEAAIWGPRLRTPLVRRKGVLEPATWQEALAAAANSLRLLRDCGRHLAVMGSGRATNEENFLATTLARSGLGTGNIDAGLRVCWDSLVEGLGQRHVTPDLSRTLERLEHADLIFVIEGDLATTHPRVAFAVMRAVRQGARLITMAWAPTSLSGFAALHMPLQARAPLASLAALQGALAASGHRRSTTTAPPNAAVADATSLSGWLREARQTAFVVGAFDRDPALLRSAAAAVRALAADLVAMGRPDPLILPLPIKSNTRGSLEMGVVPDLLPSQHPLNDEAAQQRLQQLWGGKPCFDRGRAVEEFVGAVEGMVVIGDELSAFHTRPSDGQRALEKLECLVVIDSWLTSTAKHAHVVLPMAAFGECEGTLTNLSGRVQRVRAFNAPPDGVRQGWDILVALLGSLGSSFKPRSAGDVFAAIGQAIPAYADLDHAALDDGWGAQLKAMPQAENLAVGIGDVTRGREEPAAARTGTKVLRRDGAFDWSSDPLVAFSPTLRRDGLSRRRLNPRGQVAIGIDDAKALGVREGWTVRLRSAQGEADVAVTLRPGLESGVLFVPFAFRDDLAGVLGGSGVTEVEIART